MRRAGLIVDAAVAHVVGAVGTAQRASACTCMAPRARVLTPSDTAPAPRTARVRVELPARALMNAQLLLRVVDGPVVKVMTAQRTLGAAVQIQLTPTLPLAVKTRYELALVRKQLPQSTGPHTLVFGTFVTGEQRDHDAPRFAGIHHTRALEQKQAMGGMCAIAALWGELSARPAVDPKRPNARLLYALWIADERGKLQLSTHPAAFLTMHEGKIQVSDASLCKLMKIAFRREAVPIAVAAVDESGNRSKIHRTTLDFTHPLTP
jgi:hypothetical protein